MNVVCLVAVVLCFGGSPEWKTFAPKGAGFSAAIPGTPAEARESNKTAQGTIEIRFFSLTAKEGTYVIGVTEYPEGAVPAGQDQYRLDQARDGAVQKVKGRLRWEKKLVVEGKSAREFFIATETGHAIKVRLVADGNRLFQLMVVGNTGFLESAEAGRFMDSFRLAK